MKIVSIIIFSLLNCNGNALRLAHQQSMAPQELIDWYNNGYWRVKDQKVKAYMSPYSNSSIHLLEGLGPMAFLPANEINNFWEMSEDMKPDYEWVLKQGKMEFFDGDHLCRTLGGDANILVVGDSVSNQFMEKIGSMMSAKAATTSTLTIPKHMAVDNMNKRFSICGGRGSLVYIRNDWLDTRLEGYGPPSGLIGGARWCSPKATNGAKTVDHGNIASAKSIHEYSSAHCAPWADPDFVNKFDVAILNTGIHKVPEELYDSLLKGTANFVQDQAKKDTLFFFRTTMPGLANCRHLNNDPPFPSLASAEDYVEKNPFYDSDIVKTRNQHAKDLLLPAGVMILDVYSPSMLRKDGHGGLGGDCLHYHVTPNPTDHWVRLLYNLVRDMRT